MPLYPPDVGCRALVRLGRLLLPAGGHRWI